MRYALLIHTDRSLFPTDAVAGGKLAAEYTAFTQEILDSKEMLAGDRLHWADTATTVRVRNGSKTITDGPFAETREQLGGYYIVDVPHLDRALELAAKIPGARMGSIEVRPIMENPADD